MVIVLLPWYGLANFISEAASMSATQNFYVGIDDWWLACMAVRVGVGDLP